MDRVLSPYELAWRRAAGHEAPAATSAPLDPPKPDAAPALDPLPADVIEPDPDAATTAPPLVEPAGLTVTFASSNIRSAALDAATGVLEVEFKDGKRYRYGNFTAELIAQWRLAESPGKWFDAQVKRQPAAHPPIAR